MIHKCIVVKIGGSKKCELREKRKFNVIRGKIYKFCSRNMGEFIIFLKMLGEYAICIIDLGDWTPLFATSFFILSLPLFCVLFYHLISLTLLIPISGPSWLNPDP